MARVLIFLTPCAMVVACAGGDAATDPTVADSAGVTIVDNPAAAVEAAPRWTVDPEPVLDLGVVGGDATYQFSDVRDAVLLPDGRIVVADGGANVLRYYDENGGHLRDVGGEGEGPGEFRGLTALVPLPGDSLLAFDRRLERFSLFGPDGGFVESRRLTDIRFAGFVGRLPGGAMVLRPATIFGSGDLPDEGAYSDSVTFVAVNRSGTVVDTLRRARGGDYFLQSEGQRFMVSPLLFGRRTQATLGDDRLYVGRGDRYAIRVYGPGGDLERIVRRHHEPRTVTSDDVERAIAERVEAFEDESRRRERRRFYEAMPVPETMPAYQGMLVDVEGRLWVDDFEPFREDGSRWTVFGPDGRVAAVAELPARFTPYRIEDGRVMGRWRDEFDVDHVRIYRLVHGEEGP